MAIDGYLNAAVKTARNKPKKVKSPGSMVKKATKGATQSEAMAQALMQAAQKLYGQK